MTGAVAVAAVVGLLSLLGGVALGWHLRPTDDGGPSCAGCGRGEDPALPESAAAAP
ncbi:hypothetical protein [Paractinoplanes brasiliensis]|uniref:Uncharacterized protein n=1 Tax=Paractinoplanes brasiliensis TaxID=52695 RepID=A0A4R6JVY5_9ACTN|nr:hypothetical protein [Actinoplanes brasiliensis]TDO39741.1 hypothetical protein C8E87_3440 [Actinoplanes brasiliensis]GID28922.1 hypothetical protein Abr02nite_39050 [Actinoplanes brasiliensis]